MLLMSFSIIFIYYIYNIFNFSRLIFVFLIIRLKQSRLFIEDWIEKYVNCNRRERPKSRFDCYLIEIIIPCILNKINIEETLKDIRCICINV